jgi:hypothetical protein
MRVLGLLKMSEHPGEPPAELFEAMDRTIKEISETTTLIDTNGLVPSAVAATVIHGSGGKITTVDGPFTESKELIGGYAFFEVETWEEAVETMRKIVAVHTDHWPTWEGSAEVRRVMELDEQPKA